MMTNDAPQSVSISEHHGKARRTRYRLAISDIGERVVTCVDPDVTIDSDILLAEDHSCLRAFSGILEILGDCWRVRSNRLCCRAPKYRVRVIHCCYGCRIATIVCGAPSRRRGCHLIYPTGSTTPRTCRAGGQQHNQEQREYRVHDYAPSHSVRPSNASVQRRADLWRVRCNGGLGVASAARGPALLCELARPSRTLPAVDVAASLLCGLSKQTRR